MEFTEYELELKVAADEAITNLERNLSKITLGGANPQLVSGLQIDYYGSLSPVGDLVAISHPEAQQLLVKPFDPTIVKPLYNLIAKQNYALTIQDEGDKLRLIFPVLTTEKRRETTKQLSTIKEQAKIKVRNARHAVLKRIKTDSTLSEDLEKQYQEQVQTIVDQYTHKIDALVKDKEIQLMKM